MTRDGSLAYYLAAWACGCFFMSVSLWLALTFHSGHYRSISQPVALQNFWLFCFFGWVLGAGTSVLGAFILRRVAHLFKLRSAINWVSLGSVLIVALVFALGELSKWVTPSSPILAAIIGYSFLQAPATILETGWWLSIPPGAATALILFRVDRAFSPQVQGAGSATP